VSLISVTTIAILGSEEVFACAWRNTLPARRTGRGQGACGDCPRKPETCAGV